MTTIFQLIVSLNIGTLLKGWLEIEKLVFSYSINITIRVERKEIALKVPYFPGTEKYNKEMFDKLHYCFYGYNTYLKLLIFP